jgi:nitric oxide reductase subunit B
LALLALGACSVTLISGVAAALTYTDHEPILRSIGLTLQHLRPIHETYAFAWVLLGGVTIVNFYLCRTFGPASLWMQRRVIWQNILWAVAGVGILVTLLSGWFTGREYLGYHPVFSVLILIGWLLFAWNYFEKVGISLRKRPVYVYMWSTAIALFAITYLEGHLYLFDFVSRRPVRDIAIQWKSNGVLVGSFNQLAYGSLMYLTGCIRGNDDYAYSRTAFALFCIGLLNTFTNYGHHTYHLPQSPWIHWISFVVSMLEMIILAKVFLDLLALRRTVTARQDLRVPDLFVRSATIWTFLLLLLALFIAVPPLNALIHGTHVVVAHSMGSMIGINSMILWAALAYLVHTLVGPAHSAMKGTHVLVAAILVNLFFLTFILSYIARGVAAASVRYVGPSALDLSLIFKAFPTVMVISGTGLAVTILWILTPWMIYLWSATRATRLSVTKE